MSRRVAAMLVAATLAASACGGDASPPPLVTTTTAPAGEAPEESSAPSTTTGTSADAPAAVSVEQVDCPEDLSRSDGVALACGVVVVPLDRDGPQTADVEITIAVLEGADPEAVVPLAVLQGGPGGASVDLAAWFPRQAYTQVFIDQRGTGFRGPDLDCPEIVDALETVLSVDFAAGQTLAEDAYATCAARLRDEPVLAHASTEAHAADVVDVMGSLGYTTWAVYGVSYGSTIALEILRDDPDGVHAVVLDGVYPPELDTELGLVESAERAVDEIDEACGLAAVCRSVVPDGFRVTLERVMAELDTEPMVVRIDGDLDLLLDGGRLAELAFLTMYHESLLRHLPPVVAAIDDRDADAARWLARTGARLLESAQQANDEGTYFAVQCHDRLPFTDGPGDELAPFAAAVAAADLDGICEPWGLPGAGDEVAEPVEGAIPTLLLSGSFDPITPPEYAEAVAERLETAVVVEQVGRGHGIWYGSDCIAGIVERFIAAPDPSLDIGCADEPVPVEWARP